MNDAINGEKVFTLIALYYRKKDRDKKERCFLVEFLYCFNVFSQDSPSDS